MWFTFHCKQKTKLEPYVIFYKIQLSKKMSSQVCLISYTNQYLNRNTTYFHSLPPPPAFEYVAAILIWRGSVKNLSSKLYIFSQ